MSDESRDFLNTVGGETSFFRSVMRARPVGKFREFHVMTIRNWIQKDTGHLVSPSAIWEKLNETWNLQVLENLEDESSSDDSDSEHEPMRAPSPSDNLNSHPFFTEYDLPYESLPGLHPLLDRKRRRSSPSPESTPVQTPRSSTTGAGTGIRRTRAQSNAKPSGKLSTKVPRGSVGKRGRGRGSATKTGRTRTSGRLRTNSGAADEESDISALTQEESGDEAGSANAGTPESGVTQNADQEDEENEEEEEGDEEEEDEDDDEEEEEEEEEETISTRSTRGRGRGRGRGTKPRGGARGRPRGSRGGLRSRA